MKRLFLLIASACMLAPATSFAQEVKRTEDDKTVTFSNVNNATLKVVNDFTSDGGGTQFRCTGVTINYAE